MFELIPWSSLFGGMLLGVSATLLMVVNGRTAGISGILNGVLTPKKNNTSWRVLFLIGMVLGGVSAVVALNIDTPNFAQLSSSTLVIGGLLVGFGTRLANGCTSGHGICGMGRLSKRSIVATCVFMLTAAVTVYISLN
ncbi:YeeE/YedE family protein [Vibrio sp. RE86]|uniref:YeeE/YedE family protein n=1 Tax=Vibrio sp. RE86 TaxID=2607605 RepID=UPI0014939F39|nr:YeeE/YedE family protein [Vibrio sp. RE86]NOH81716.1 YeeE/YedE family protein [Vibrio sp. RE86]